MKTHLNKEQLIFCIEKIMPELVDVYNDEDYIIDTLQNFWSIDESLERDYLDAIDYLYLKCKIGNKKTIKELALYLFNNHGLNECEDTGEIIEKLSEILIFDKNTNWKNYEFLVQCLSVLAYDSDLNVSELSINDSVLDKLKIKFGLFFEIEY